MVIWRCLVCAYRYDEEHGEPGTGTPPGIRFSELPKGWRCPICGADKRSFALIEDDDVHADAATTVSDIMVQEMVRSDIDVVFGIPGGSSLPLVDSIRRHPDMRYVVMRHEGNAALAASAYNKLSGRMAACLTIAGPGATNLATGLYDAKEDRASVLSINGQVRSQYSGPGGNQEIDQDAFFRPICVYNNTVYDKDMSLRLLDIAIKHARLGHGVSQLSVPNNVQKEPLLEQACLRETCASGLGILPPAEELGKAVALIEEAGSPVIVAGWGTWGMGADLADLAERIQAPVVTTWRAKGVLPDDHPWLAGIHGNVGSPGIRDLVLEADLVIALGLGFSRMTDIPCGMRMVQVDIDPLRLGRYPAEVALWGDCAQVLPWLLQHLNQRPSEGVLARIAELKQGWHATLEREADEEARPIRPPYVMKVLSDTLPADAVISLDVGENGWWFGRNFRSSGQRFTMSGYLGTMGAGLPGAIAAKILYPERPVVCITGDGGFQMAMGDLVTAVRERLPMVIVLMNNHELGMIRVEQRMERYPNFATGLYNPDYSQFAESCGAVGIRIEDPAQLRETVVKALAMDEVVLLDVETDPRRFPEIEFDSELMEWSEKDDMDDWPAAEEDVTD